MAAIRRVPRLCQPCWNQGGRGPRDTADTGTTLCVVLARLLAVFDRVMNNPGYAAAALPLGRRGLAAAGLCGILEGSGEVAEWSKARVC